MERITEVKRTEGGGIIVRGEYDLLEDMRQRVARKIEVDGEEALELALAEVGYIKERICGNLWQHGFMCTECKTSVSWLNAINYCPTCGARVVSDDD